jgi:hypothetical protein
MKRIVPGTPEYIEHQSIVKALHVAFIAAATGASATTNNDTTPNKEARASSEIAGWQQAMDTEMANLRNLGCWTLVPWSDLFAYPAQAFLLVGGISVPQDFRRRWSARRTRGVSGFETL